MIKLNDSENAKRGEMHLVTIHGYLVRACRGYRHTQISNCVMFAGCADSDETLVLCDRIHDRVANVMKDICPVTVSIGVATRLGKYRSSFDDLLKQADYALYSAKADGKNRTAVCGNIRLSPIIQQTRQPDLNMLAVSNHK